LTTWPCSHFGLVSHKRPKPSLCVPSDLAETAAATTRLICVAGSRRRRGRLLISRPGSCPKLVLLLGLSHLKKKTWPLCLSLSAYVFTTALRLPLNKTPGPGFQCDPNVGCRKNYSLCQKRCKSHFPRS